MGRAGLKRHRYVLLMDWRWEEVGIEGGDTTEMRSFAWGWRESLLMLGLNYDSYILFFRIFGRAYYYHESGRKEIG